MTCVKKIENCVRMGADGKCVSCIMHYNNVGGSACYGGPTPYCQRYVPTSYACLFCKENITQVGTTCVDPNC